MAFPRYVAFALAFLVLPFAVSRRASGVWAGRSAPWLASALATPAFFPVIHDAFVAAWGKAWIGVLPVGLAAVSVGALAAARRQIARSPSEARLRLRHLAAFGAVALGFVTLAIPLQLDRQWITVGWAMEALAVWWLFGRLPHPGLKYLGAGLLAAVGVRLLVNPEVLRYQERGLPVFNWLLYTYGVPALCLLLRGGGRSRARKRRGQRGRSTTGPAGRPHAVRSRGRRCSGLLLTFWLINLEVFDYFSPGRYVELGFERQFARDLTLSVGLGRLRDGAPRAGPAGARSGPCAWPPSPSWCSPWPRCSSTISSTLTGLYRVLSFLGLGVSLILVSLLYQRFVIAKKDEE